MHNEIFSGSYASSDVQFLLKVIDMPVLDVSEKERRIQQQTAHYSEMLSRELPPSAEYMELYEEALASNGVRMAQDVLTLAKHLHATHPINEPIALVSLARAGTPVGVLLNRTLSQVFNRMTSHYSVSIIRDKGIDLNAMKYILERHADTEIAFIDGWTGKGVITEELKCAIEALNSSKNLSIDSSLYVLSDLAGVAGYCASHDDYLIPSSILNSTVSGLVSRTILNDKYIGPDDFHGCVYYREYENIDLSSRFVFKIFQHVLTLANEQHTGEDTLSESLAMPSKLALATAAQVNVQNAEFVQQMLQACGLTNRNYVKPGIGEATRVLLRRVPDVLFVRDKTSQDTRHLVRLSIEKNVPVFEDPTLLYKAAAIIKVVD